MKLILQDEFVEDVIREWVFRQTRSLPAYMFDTIAASAANDLGLKHIDTIRLRKVHLDEWNRRIRLLSDGADEKREARRLVEQSLLAEADNYIPVTGGDIIEKLNVPPGPEVGKILRRAQESYRQKPCGREELLSRLAENKS